MNKQRLYDLIVNIKDTLAMIDRALEKLNTIEDEELKLLIKSSLKQSFLEYFILIESFSSMCLKELKIYKMSDDMEKSLNKLKDNNIINQEMLDFLNQYRRYRNRIVHVYKQPSTEEIIEFINMNKEKINSVVNVMSIMYKNI